MRVNEVILHFLSGENEGVEIKLTPPRELYIGRSEESDIFLGEKKISRKHSMIQVSDLEVRITDLESTNGTFVNSKKITETVLKNGDRIKVGSSVIEVEVQSGNKSKSGTPSVEKSNPKSPPKKSSPEKEKFERERSEKEVPGGKKKIEALDSEKVSEPFDLEDFNEGPSEKIKVKQKSKDFEEDSDLVVEYQTSIKEPQEIKENETSEKIVNLKKETPSSSEDLEVEEDPSDFEDLNVEVEEDQDSQDENMTASAIDKNDEPSFDKFDAMDLEEDVSIDEEESQPKSLKPLMGDLSSMGLSDLIQNLHQNRKTGLLTLSTVNLSGKIFLKDGALLGAESGKCKGLKAMYRMLTWKNGDFEFQPMSGDDKKLITSHEPIQESIETILMEGFRQYDELRKIQKVLPQMEDDLALEEQLEVPISKLHPKVLDIVQLIINHKKMKTVLDLSPMSDLEISKIVFYLIKKKVIRIKK